jgi:ornithine lipid ester-linked acyl 2-hydroxylase
MYYDASRFAFVADLEAHWYVVHRELSQLTHKDFIAWPEKYLYGKGWDIFGLYAFGFRIEDNCKICPETTKLVERIPNLVTAGFSSLAPGTHIKPHTGYPEGLLRCHLGLFVPEDCALRVGAETRPWQAGRCLVFDDTSEHEAWNRSCDIRIVLLLDFKAPPGVLPEPEKPKKKGLFDFLKK